MTGKFASIVTFFGNVQGVGFRKRTKLIASNHAVSGYVKNLPDGSVELYVEGNEEDCHSFVDSVKREMCEEISAVHSKVTSVLGRPEFSIEI
jgi:acylphosphatase